MSYIETFNQCNIHLVEADKKRDQIIAFYATLVGAFFAFANINNPESNPQVINNLQIIKYFTIILVIIGIILAFLILEYRKWHIRYSNTVRALNPFVVNPKSKKDETCIKIGKKVYEDYGIINQKKIMSRKFIVRYFKGVESLTFQVFLVVSYFPIHLLIDFLRFGFSNHMSWWCVFIIDLFCYLLVTNLIAVFLLYNDFKNFSLFANWILPNNFPESIFFIKPKKLLED